METTAQHSVCTCPNRCTVQRPSLARWPPNWPARGSSVGVVVPGKAQGFPLGLVRRAGSSSHNLDGLWPAVFFPGFFPGLHPSSPSHIGPPTGGGVA